MSHIRWKGDAERYLPQRTGPKTLAPRRSSYYKQFNSSRTPRISLHSSRVLTKAPRRPLLIRLRAIDIMADSEKHSKFSLRTKKNRRSKDLPSVPQISKPQPLQKPTPAGSAPSSNGIPPARPRQRNAQDGTSNLIKKRMSYRYNQNEANGFGEPPAVPGMPAIPKQFMQGREPSPAKRVQGIDMRALADPNLHVDSCG